MKARAPVWTMQDAIAWARKLEMAAIDVGYHVALGGSVLHAGVSFKDLDLIVYPHSSGISPKGLIAGAIERAGLTYKRGKNAKYPNGEDDKEIRVYETPDGRRVDIFFLR